MAQLYPNTQHLEAYTVKVLKNSAGKDVSFFPFQNRRLIFALNFTYDLTTSKNGKRLEKALTRVQITPPREIFGAAVLLSSDLGHRIKRIK